MSAKSASLALADLRGIFVVGMSSSSSPSLSAGRFPAYLEKFGGVEVDADAADKRLEGLL